MPPLHLLHANSLPEHVLPKGSNRDRFSAPVEKRFCHAKLQLHKQDLPALHGVLSQQLRSTRAKTRKRAMTQHYQGHCLKTAPTGTADWALLPKDGAAFQSAALLTTSNHTAGQKLYPTTQTPPRTRCNVGLKNWIECAKTLLFWQKGHQITGQ